MARPFSCICTRCSCGGTTAAGCRPTECCGAQAENSDPGGEEACGWMAGPEQRWRSTWAVEALRLHSGVALTAENPGGPSYTWASWSGAQGACPIGVTKYIGDQGREREEQRTGSPQVGL
ncbi:hypothetical protein NDU88_006541 [Pleurodeles waltl]|uniref:Uncharacterized protein n=1 Tax=Pleurodeles waltl TaxID=8319 RepID=A0AAV7WEB7_PLEWA|nr:hypothetical protein NDU88_006541 [Pleurodeles waltl]